MNKSALTWVVVVIIILLAGAGIYYFLSNYSGKSNNSSSQSVATNSVEIKNFAFNPSNIKISKGSTVTWTNSDSATHTIKSDTGVFESQNIAPGQTYIFTFTDSGTFPYHCSIHPSMTGLVVVE